MLCFHSTEYDSYILSIILIEGIINIVIFMVKVRQCRTEK